MTLPTPPGWDSNPIPKSNKPETDDSPKFGDDMSTSELKSAIIEYQEWCAENYDDLEIDLDEIPVEISTKMKKTAGKVVHIKGSDNVKYIRYALGAYQKWGWEQFAETIRHELIHVHTVQNYSRGGHGRLFKQLVEPLETHRHCESFSEDEAKYILYCSGCDSKVASRFRKSKTVKNPDQYRSKCCNSSLRVESN